jgi:hypothetical protein
MYHVLGRHRAQRQALEERQTQPGTTVLLGGTNAGAAIDLNALAKKLPNVLVVHGEDLANCQPRVDHLKIQVVDDYAYR